MYALASGLDWMRLVNGPCERLLVSLQPWGTYPSGPETLAGFEAIRCPVEIGLRERVNNESVLALRVA
jgi:hypothetical protein